MTTFEKLHMNSIQNASSQSNNSADQLIKQFVERHSLTTGNSGILLFGGVKCVLSLSDLPTYIYQRVNEYLLSKTSFSLSSLL